MAGQGGYQSKSSRAAPVWLSDDDGNAIAFPSSTAADATGAQKAAVYQPRGYQRVTATTTAFGLPSPPAGARRVIVQAEANALRWRDDGTDPTTTTGMTIPAGGELRYDGAITAMRLIAVTAGAIAHVIYYS